MRILSIGGSSHDFSASVLENGRIVIAIEDERVNRIKHGGKNWYSRPAKPSVDYCLNSLNLTIDHFDYIYSNIDLDVTHQYITRSVRKVPHHLAHAASAFYPSPNEKAALMVIDGHGSLISDMACSTVELETISVGKGNFNKIELDVFQSGEKKLTSGTWQYITQNSLGSFYKIITDGIGFGMRGQGKTMGLAAYGNDIFYQEMLEFITIEDDGRFLFDPYSELYDWIMDKLMAGKNHFQVRADISHAAQKIFEETILKIAKTCFKKNGSDHLCYGGGCALNGSANYRILAETPFKSLFIFPAAGDNGLSIGAGYYGYYHELGHKREVPRSLNYGDIVFKGHMYSDGQYKEALCHYPVFYKKTKKLVQEVGERLKSKSVIGLFQGPSEIGPRALGNRSIVADPTTISMRDHINIHIKDRETFRPIAPVIPVEHVSEYFDFTNVSPFMLLIAPIKPKYEKLFRGITHIDGTARLQTVDKISNPFLHALLMYYKQLTGHPILMNTSFNRRGEPIVETPKDAISTFIKTEIDALVLGEYLVEKHTPWAKRNCQRNSPL